MEILFEGPTFFASQDEDAFFGWLHALPCYQTILGVGTTLNLQLSTTPDAETLQQLLVIFRRWRIDVKPLMQFKSSQNAHLALWDSDI